MTFPALKNLGVNRPHEISGYTLSTHNDIDTLRIKYVRQKGSLLPTAKRFQFPRRPMPGVQATPGQLAMTQISPALEEALEELAELLDTNHTAHDKKELLFKEMDEFQTYVNERIREFKVEIEKL